MLNKVQVLKKYMYYKLYGSSSLKFRLLENKTDKIKFMKAFNGPIDSTNNNKTCKYRVCII